MDSAVRPSDDGRAWLEIDLDAIAYNAARIRSLLPGGCELMAVVKADAYGHGAVRVAERLRREGVSTFAVASVVEGIQLRDNGIDGEILVLGYTHPKDAGFLHTHDLTQLVVDGEHAKALNAAGHKLRVHIAVDTGMHRLGVEPSNFEEIENIYACKNLAVEGVATHLASSDSLDSGDVEFTKRQLESFFSVVDTLKGKGYSVGNLHVHASYGVFNYPDTKCGYLRAGIALYGVMSGDAATVIAPELRPVLSLRAVIAQTRWIDAGESVSYGRIFTAGKRIKTATVCAGYGDGVPRNLSGHGFMCIVNGHKVPIIGRICMDMFVIDVTEADRVAAGDVVTLIGRDGDEEVRCEDFAAAAGTITNEILCRLGSRLPRVYVN